MYLMRPVLAGLCKYESLTNGALDLADVALMNAALLVDSENQYRMHKASEEGKQ